MEKYKKNNNSVAEDEIFLRVKNLDISTGYPWIAIINEGDARHLGIRPGDKLTLKWKRRHTVISVDTTTTLVKEGEVGLFREITEEYKLKKGDLVGLSIAGYASSLKTIYKKLRGGKLSKGEVYNLVSDIVNYKIDDIELAFFIASAFNRDNFSLEEVNYLTQAIADTGEKLKLGKIVADKHSIGGIPGNCTTPIVVSIIASEGIRIPKTSSRAVTSAAGTADAMEVLMPVELPLEKIKEVVEKTNGCLVWGGAVKLAPADDRFIKICYHLGIEPLSKMVVSIMAKKLAAGATHLVIDMPVGPTAKIATKKDREWVEKLFLFVSKKCHIKTRVMIQKVKGPVGRGIGPALKARDVLLVLEQKNNRPFDLEKKAVHLAGTLLELVGRAKKGEGEKVAWAALRSGRALAKMKEIIEAQGGNPQIEAKDIQVGKVQYAVKSPKSGRVYSIDNKYLVHLARLLGAPLTKEAGIYLGKIVGDKVKKGDVLCTFYSQSRQRLDLAKEALLPNKLYDIH